MRKLRRRETFRGVRMLLREVQRKECNEQVGKQCTIETQSIRHYRIGGSPDRNTFHEYRMTIVPVQYEVVRTDNGRIAQCVQSVSLSNSCESWVYLNELFVIIALVIIIKA